ncbi:TetR/AcrR family transcriptional regulator C-terminal domain-containing protein [Amycolatopsis sp. YIM 10]|uniref:TetR/AcrR family transcriptional regulator C-terminal domain-containing protein n=1 Tax=Amycolatopsis sp. YIM 10 TaxID=2653857 RepID=UPI00129064E7|nr:TetR/AcrR family transcriptional regulator C-terminal domain-containing protein [Amycolatopsis sp. YIM 10]QFU90564.1 Tetracycline repressor protein class H [Amycolatopsis sp. YIM 10]
MTQTTDRESATKARLSQSSVLTEAIALADREGLEAVTIRRLAQDLGVTPMALYWHFRNKSLLLEALGGEVIAEVDLTVNPADPWHARFRTLISALVDTLRRHPWAVSLFTARVCESPSYLVALETVLEILDDAGFSPAEAAAISRHAISSAMGMVSGEPGVTGPLAPEDAEESQRRAKLFYESLPSKRYPRVIAAAGPLTSCDDRDSYYAFGLDLLVAGVEAMAARRP